MITPATVRSGDTVTHGGQLYEFVRWGCATAPNGSKCSAGRRVPATCRLIRLDGREPMSQCFDAAELTPLRGEGS